MGKYLKKFENHSAYEVAQSSLILPNVSLCVQENEVHYNPSSPTPPTPSHDYVEIGGIKWATMNVGANSITDIGLYFQWGDTQGYTAEQVGDGEGQKYFGWEDYKYWTSDTGSGSSGMTKYNSTDGLTTLEASDDAVTAAWGGNWRMPTTAEFQALKDAVNTGWTYDYQGSGIEGLICTDKEDNSKVLFFRNGDYFANGNAYAEGRGYYWSSSLRAITPRDAWGIHIPRNGQPTWKLEWRRFYGMPVRGVLDE